MELTRQNRQVLDKLAGHTEMYAAALAAGEMSVEAQLALLDGLGSRAGQLDETLQALAVRRRGLERELQKLTKELEQQRSVRPRERYQANVEVEVLQAGELTVELSYIIGGAHWKPFYDLRLVEGEGQPTLELGYLAQVGQIHRGELGAGQPHPVDCPPGDGSHPARAGSLVHRPAPATAQCLYELAAVAPAAAPQAKMRAVHSESAPETLDAAPQMIPRQKRSPHRSIALARR